MRRVFVAMLAFAPSCILSAGAVYMAVHGVAGWGWFLFVAVLIGGSYSFSSKGES